MLPDVIEGAGQVSNRGDVMIRGAAVPAFGRFAGSSEKLRRVDRANWPSAAVAFSNLRQKECSYFVGDVESSSS